MGPRLVELSSTTLCSLGLPPHVGRGDAAVLRSTRSESFFDFITKLRAEDKELQERLADPLRRPPQSQLEIGIIDGKLTDVNPLDRIALLRVAEEIQDVGALPSPQAIELYVSTRAVYELAGGASSGSEEEQDVEEEESGELPPPPPVALATAEDAERLLDAVAVHAESPTSMWGCCGGVRDDSRTPYYCDGCNLYFHHGCAENQSKGRQAPLCPSCHAQALAGGRSARRRVAGP